MRRTRYAGPDTLRGLTLVSMMFYHACWDLAYIFGMDWGWYASFGSYLWQQSICWTFILLSGFCWSLGRHRLKRGLMAFGGGAHRLHRKKETEYCATRRQAEDPLSAMCRRRVLCVCGSCMPA